MLARRVFLSGLGVWLFLVAASCSRDDEIAIVCLGSYSSREASLDLAGRDGMRLAVEEVNHSGILRNRRIRLISVDVQDDPQLMVAMLQRYADSGYKIFVPPFRSRFAQGVLQFAHRDDFLILNATMTADTLYGRKDAVLNLSPRAGLQGRVLAEYIVKRGYNPVWILLNGNNRFYTGYVVRGIDSVLFAHRIARQVRELNGSIHHFFPAVAESVAVSNPAAVVLLFAGEDAGVLAQHLRLRGYKGPLLGSQWTSTGELLEYGGTAVEGLVAVCLSQIPTQQRRAFDAAYRNAYGRHPSFAAHAGYDIIHVLAETVAGSNKRSDDGKSWRTLMVNGAPIRGVSGEIIFDEFGDVRRPPVLSTVRQGVFVELVP